MKATLVVFLVFLAVSVPIYLFAPTAGIDLFGNLGQLTALLFSAVSFWQARMSTRDRFYQRTTVRIALGLCIWTLGQLMVTYSELLLHKSPYGTVSSSFFVLGYALIALALISLLKHSWGQVSKEKSHSYIVQAFVLGVLASLIIFVKVGNPFLQTERDLVWQVLDLLYPFFDTAIMLIAFLLLRQAWDQNEIAKAKAYVCLLVAFVLLEACDLMTRDAEFESVIYRAVDVLYFTSYFLIAFSGRYFTRALWKNEFAHNL